MTRLLRHYLWPAFAILAVMTLLTGVVYPAVVTAIAQVAFPSQANGSMIVADGKVIGSSLIGQAFNDPKYFWGRPSAAGADGYDASGSAGSNLGPTSQALIARISAEVDRLRAANGDKPIPVDLVTTSASGPDPTSAPPPRSTRSRVAKARGHQRGRHPGCGRSAHRAAVPRLPGPAARQRAGAQPRPRRTDPMTDPERDALDVRPTGDEMLARLDSEGRRRDGAG